MIDTQLNSSKIAFEDYLLEVRRPARYIGQEFNSRVKEIKKSDINIGLCFPDTYEVGMSHLGIKILYSLLNKQPGVCCERCFAPWTDMEQIMRRHKIELFALESKRPLKAFDIIGFSLQYELGYTNVLNMLELANLPLKAKERDGLPLIIAGGPCCSNPEPMAEFIDAFVIGEAEEVILELIKLYHGFKKEISNIAQTNLAYLAAAKRRFLTQLAKVGGIYVPQFYEPRTKDGFIFEVRPKTADFPKKITRRYIKNLNTAEVPTCPPVPYIDVIHDRISLEIMRGCPNQCYFCQAGFVLNPVRVRSVDKILQLVKETYRHTGYENISFCALSSASYPHLKELITQLHLFCREKGLGISLPSLRIDKDFLGILSLIGELKKTGLTFAPEAGSMRLRKVINKNIDIEALKEAVCEAYRAGWRRLKLYFMIGLPTETESDIQSIVDLIEEFSALRKPIAGKFGRVRVGISNFIPKPHTPLQWLAMEEKENLLRKQRFLKSRLMGKRFEVNFHNLEMSFLEAYLCRADRNAHRVILKAFRLGARFDAWTNMFDYNIWQQAFKESEIAPEKYVYKRRDLNLGLPWEHIDCGTPKQTLLREIQGRGLYR